MVMDKCTEFYPVEGEIFSAERVVVPGVLEVPVVCYSVTLGGGGMVGLMKSFPLEEWKDLLTMGKKQNERWVEGSRSLLQISKKYN